MIGPTKRQAEILSFIAATIDDLGYPPSMREIAAAHGFSSTYAVDCHLMALAIKGLIRRAPRKARAITVTAAGCLALQRGGT